MGERIKKLRKDLGLTQQEFAERLNISRGTLANYEVGRNNPIDAVITLICREFNVNETWLRTGTGEMFINQTREAEITAFFDDILLGEPDFRKRFVSVLARMTPEEWDILEKKVLELAGEVQEAAQRKEARELGQKAARLTESELLIEKEPDIQALSVKESGAV